MGKLRQFLWMLYARGDTLGQDLVEYALLAGFVAVASGIFVPDVSATMSKIYSRLASKLVDASG